MKKASLTLTAAFAFAGITSAAVFIQEDFESYTLGANMHGQGPWVVSNDDASPGTAPHPVAVESSLWGPVTNLNAAYVGGYAGLTNPVSMVQSGLGISVLSSPQPAYFQIEMAIVDSGGIYTIRDDFYLSLTDGADNVFTINFTAQDPTGATDPGVWDVSWTSDFATGQTVGTINEFTDWTTITLQFGDMGGGNAQFTLLSDGNTIDVGTLTGVGSTVIDEFRAGWQYSGGTPPEDNFGDNFMALDNITLIPEPTSFALLGLGAMVGLRRRRQA